MNPDRIIRVTVAGHQVVHQVVHQAAADHRVVEIAEEGLPAKESNKSNSGIL